MADETIGLNDTQNYTIPANHEVVIPNAITFEQDGEVVAQVSATYDTKDLPPELHHLFFQLASKHCHRLILPSARQPEPKLEPPKPKRKSRWFSWFR